MRSRSNTSTVPIYDVTADTGFDITDSVNKFMEKKRKAPEFKDVDKKASSIMIGVVELGCIVAILVFIVCTDIPSFQKQSKWWRHELVRKSGIKCNKNKVKPA